MEDVIKILQEIWHIMGKQAKEKAAAFAIERDPMKALLNIQDYGELYERAQAIERD